MPMLPDVHPVNGRKHFVAQVHMFLWNVVCKPCLLLIWTTVTASHLKHHWGSVYLSPRQCTGFSALTLLVGWQEGHPAC